MKQIFPLLLLLTSLAMTACTSANGMVQAAVSTVTPTATPTVVAFTATPTAVEPVVEPTPTVRVVMIASDPTTFELAAGQPQLVEFFTFW